MMWDVIIHYFNTMPDYVGLYMCGDEPSWCQQVWDEANSVLAFKIVNRPGVSKGGKIVMVTDLDSFLPIVYEHQNNIHNQP